MKLVRKSALLMMSDLDYECNLMSASSIAL